jgi:Protein tyrosine and serine/threonine kinase
VSHVFCCVTTFIFLAHYPFSTHNSFGLSRKIEEGATEHQTKQKQGPARWWAIECIKKGTFSEKTEVWAWAVTAWETHNSAQVPYGKEPTIEVVRQVLGGRRLDYPEKIPPPIRELYMSCMAEAAGKRPTFAKCVEVMDEIVDGEGDEVVYASLAGVLEGM